MFELEKDPQVQRLIQMTKSDSGVSGVQLALAHMKLGGLLAEQMDLDPEDTTVVAILRGGLFFAQGIYFQLGCKFQTFAPKLEKFERPKTRNVILADAVINTGKTIRDILESALPDMPDMPDIKVACCVIQKEAVPFFAHCLYTVRVSENAFVGANVSAQSGAVGPDTTLRLFNLI